MSMFPGPGAVVYRNEAGEPLGWDYPSYEPDVSDPYDEYEAQNYDTDECGACGEYVDVEIDPDTGLCPACADWEPEPREDFGYFGDPALCGE